MVHMMMKQQIIGGKIIKATVCLLLVPFSEYVNSSCRYTLGNRKAIEYCVGAYELAVIWRLTACREVYDRLVILKNTYLHSTYLWNMKLTKNDKLILRIIESARNFKSFMIDLMYEISVYVHVLMRITSG